MSGSFTKFGPEPVETSNESQAADKNYQINNQINHKINNQINNQINNPSSRNPVKNAGQRPGWLPRKQQPAKQV